jgi:hypothetical protein
LRDPESLVGVSDVEHVEMDQVVRDGVERGALVWDCGCVGGTGHGGSVVEMVVPLVDRIVLAGAEVLFDCSC